MPLVLRPRPHPSACMCATLVVRHGCASAAARCRAHSHARRLRPVCSRKWDEWCVRGRRELLCMSGRPSLALCAQNANFRRHARPQCDARGSMWHVVSRRTHGQLLRAGPPREGFSWSCRSIPHLRAHTHARSHTHTLARTHARSLAHPRSHARKHARKHACSRSRMIAHARA